MEIIPIGERVLIKPIKKEEVTKSGIYIPESAQEQKKEGSVVAVGGNVMTAATLPEAGRPGIIRGLQF